MVLVCPKCGAENSDDTAKCKICGSAIGDAAVGKRPTHYRSAVGFVLLLAVVALAILLYPVIASKLSSLYKNIVSSTTTVTSIPTTTVNQSTTVPCIICIGDHSGH
ncbi:MAG: hypothetical protein KGI00_02660 [Candidatus Micrarchaeota archaeon]|nr:hypothetical protein [Candidatus Micrarchaeota archaeon]MDE1824459.1 hypothetical protein [Candidatus Micrarchaeota archaeon]MDE1849608.1 hypothetical protein [Candidatus Micrarchaeota archaeon]